MVKYGDGKIYQFKKEIVMDNGKKIEILIARMSICPYLSKVEGSDFEFNYGEYYENWSAPHFYISEPKPGKRLLMHTFNTLVFLPEDAEKLSKTIEGCAQLLPIHVEDLGKAYMLNVYADGTDAIDWEESMFSNSENKKYGKDLLPNEKEDYYLLSNKIAFKEKEIKHCLFHVKYKNYIWKRYATRGFFDREKEFLQVYDTLGLKGMMTEILTIV